MTNLKETLRSKLEEAQKRCSSNTYTAEEIEKELNKALNLSDDALKYENAKEIIFEMWEGKIVSGYSYSTTTVTITIDRKGIKNIEIARDKKGYRVNRLYVIFNETEKTEKELRKEFKEKTRLLISGRNYIQL